MTKFIEKLLALFRRPPFLNVEHDSGGRKKPAILLLHGIAATANYWKPLLHEMDGHKYRIITVDLLGCGKSPRPIDCQYSAEDFVKSIHRTVRKLKLRKPYIIVGHSMGANISARYSAHYPTEIKAEYLLSMPLYLHQTVASPNLAIRQTDMYMKAYDFLLKNKDFTIIAAQAIRRILNITEGIDVNANDWEAFSLSLKNTVINQNTIEDLKRTKHIPVHIIYGSLDELLVQDNFKKFQSHANVQVTKLFAVDHRLGKRYAKFVASQIEAEKPLKKQ